MLHLLQENTASVGGNSTTLSVAAATLMLGAGQVLQWYAAHRKGKQGATQSTKTLVRIEEKLDAFVEAQRETNHQFDKRISEVSAHVIGPDGQNGHRWRIERLERIEEERAANPQAFGSYQPPPRRP
jgi:hypothetical protein